MKIWLFKEQVEIENGTWSFVSLSCKDSIYEDGGGSGKAYCNVLYIIRI